MPMKKDGLIVTTGRLGEKSMEKLLGVAFLPILMPSSRVAELYMWLAHTGYSGIIHRSVSQTLVRSRAWVWIVKGKDLAKRIVNSCMHCRTVRKQLSTQRMALLKEESLQCNLSLV